MQITVSDLAVVDLDALKHGSGAAAANSASMPTGRGVLMQQTSITFVKAPDSTIRLKGARYVFFGVRHYIFVRHQTIRSAGTAIIQPDFKFEDMGIGGLDTEFSAIFRRAFASRIFPPALIKKLGIQHVRGTHSIRNHLPNVVELRYLAVWTTGYWENSYRPSNWQNVKR